ENGQVARKDLANLVQKHVLHDRPRTHLRIAGAMQAAMSTGISPNMSTARQDRPTEVTDFVTLPKG
ncbi:hypothetical protein ABTE52_20880, partial [Acinetobacter baumannii]